MPHSVVYDQAIINNGRALFIVGVFHQQGFPAPKLFLKEAQQIV